MGDGVITTPINKNFLSQLEFRFLLNRAPHVNFFVQKVTIPQITLDATPQAATPFVRRPIPGDHIEFQELQVEFLVDEDFRNYLEIQEWLYGLGFPHNFSEFATLKDQPKVTGEAIFSDVKIIIMNSASLVNYEITFCDAFPTSLSALEFDTSDTDVEYISATTTFAYTTYQFERIRGE